MQLSGNVTVEIPTERLARAIAEQVVLILAESGSADPGHDYPRDPGAQGGPAQGDRRRGVDPPGYGGDEPEPAQ